MHFRIEKLLIFVFITRILLLVLPWLANTLIAPEVKALDFIRFTEISWNRWDAPHYIYLAQHWYSATGDAANFIAFFPLYPLILKLTILIIGNPALTGIFLSIILFLIGAYYFYKLVNLDYGEKIARYSVVALAIFPTSYFFNSPYTESLFLLIFACTMYAARKEKWIAAGLLTGLATVTRPSGLLLLPAILTEWLLIKKRKWRALPIILSPTLVAASLYLYLNKIIYGNPFEFQKILNIHWQKHFMWPFASIMDSWRVAISGGLTNFVIMVGWAEAITITISWILIPLTFKYLRKSWAIFYTLSIILFSSTSFILSTPRYLLSVPPIFVLIALAEKNYLFKIIWQFASIALLICLATLFTQGQWAF